MLALSVPPVGWLSVLAVLFAVLVSVGGGVDVSVVGGGLEGAGDAFVVGFVVAGGVTGTSTFAVDAADAAALDAACVACCVVC